jgi:hypothetical protein
VVVGPTPETGRIADRAARDATGRDRTRQTSGGARPIGQPLQGPRLGGTRERLRLFIDNVLAAAAPTNNPLTNPPSERSSLTPAAGAYESAYRTGETIATTPGRVRSASVKQPQH